MAHETCLGKRFYEEISCQLYPKSATVAKPHHYYALIFQTLPHLQSNISQQTRCWFQSLFFVPLSCTMCPLSIPRFNFSTSIGRLSLRTKVPLAIATGTGPDALHTRWETMRWMIFTSHIGFVVLCVFFSAQNCTTSILQYLLRLSGVRITD